MKEEYKASIANVLHTVPANTFERRQLNALATANSSLTEKIFEKAAGRGKIESLLLFPGIELSYHWYLTDHVCFQHKPEPEILDVNYCQAGRIGWKMRGGAVVYLGAGDMCLHASDCCADSEMTLPTGYYSGITVSIDLKELKQHTPDILKDANIGAEYLFQKFCSQNMPLTVPSCDAIDRIFSVLYDLPESLQIPYCKLKAQELLLYLCQMVPNWRKGLTQYASQQTERIKEIHDFLVQHLSQRFTIEQLSRKYLMNTSTLKAVFKAVYGLPIASYMKEYRMQQAMKLLRETDDSIAVIADKVGYETQGKFTKSFKEGTQILPSDYRKLYRKL